MCFFRFVFMFNHLVEFYSRNTLLRRLGYWNYSLFAYVTKQCVRALWQVLASTTNGAIENTEADMSQWKSLAWEVWRAESSGCAEYGYGYVAPCGRHESPYPRSQWAADENWYNRSERLRRNICFVYYRGKGLFILLLNFIISGVRAIWEHLNSVGFWTCRENCM